jgi:hypothetical protein
MVWIIEPQRRTVTVYRSRDDIGLLTAEDEMDGGNLLPGRVERYAAAGREAYEKSTLIQDGILRNLEVIGEAAKGIDEEHRARWPHV